MSPITFRIRLFTTRLAGFSLVEMAIVLLILALLAGGLMMTLTTQQEVQRLNEARRQLTEIREALIGFAVINNRLPLPANPVLASGDAGAGSEAPAQGELGVLPWAALGLPETDPWGQRFTYRVKGNFNAPFTLSTAGDITVTDGAANIATNLPAIVISHGRNGLGGYRSTGLQVPGAAGDEAENADADTNFVSRTQTPDFDDEVAWVPLPILMSRMIAAGRLP